MIASIPSPGSNTISIGPLDLRLYGLCIAFGALVAVWVASRRYEAAGGDADDINRVAMWGIPGGIIGARIYHVITDIDRYWGNFGDAFLIWKGGLGIWGGIAGGMLAGAYVARRENMDVPKLLNAVAPAIPIAQAIGRLGNWFNQELFGGPSTLPWAVEIDVAHRPVEFADSATFHPTFLYEATWNLLLAATLIIVVPRVWPTLKKGRLFALYVFGYCLGRLVIELMRTDHANTILGVRINVYTSVIVGLSGLYVAFRGRPGRRAETPVSSDV
ncbi:MAG: prolipoprotein diacylglyceryl transferase [Candidatus Poriferisodalaceae bacterium]|jgi:prolipoprotein diacylglyceryl transferase